MAKDRKQSLDRYPTLAEQYKTHRRQYAPNATIKSQTTPQSETYLDGLVDILRRYDELAEQLSELGVERDAYCIGGDEYFDSYDNRIDAELGPNSTAGKSKPDHTQPRKSGSGKPKDPSR